MRLKDKVAIVTGAASGIGEATIKTLAREGASAVVADLNEKDGARVADEIRKSGGTAEFLPVNIGNPAELDAMVKFTVDRFGRLDIIHNNAISIVLGRIGETTAENWRKAIDIGLTSYWHATVAAASVMVRQGGGAIVNTASVSGLGADYGLGTYNIVKAGVISLTKATAIEYARKKIRCNAVCPGPIATPPLRRLRDRHPERIAAMVAAVPMGRMGEPQEIANAVLFLASEEASYITGTTLVVDGGLMAHTGLPSITGQGPDW